MKIFVDKHVSAVVNPWVLSSAHNNNCSSRFHYHDWAIKCFVGEYWLYTSKTLYFILQCNKSICNLKLLRNVVARSSGQCGPWSLDRSHLRMTPPPARGIISEQIPGRSAHCAHCCQTRNQSPGNFFLQKKPAISEFMHRIREWGRTGTFLELVFSVARRVWVWSYGACQGRVVTMLYNGDHTCTSTPPLHWVSSNTTSTLSWQMQDTNNIFRDSTSAYLVVTKVRCVML